MILLGTPAPRAGLLLSAFLVILCITLSSQARAEVYKWVDDDGKVNYTQFPPPPGIKSETVHEAPSPATAPPDTVRQERPEKEQKDNGKDAAVAERDRKIEDIRKLNCDAATGNLAALEERSQRRYLTPDGEYLRPTEEERQKLIDQAKQQIKEFCTK